MLLRALAPLLALTFALPVTAGSEKENNMRRGALFFALLTQDQERVWVRYEDKAQVQQLAQHCNTGKAVFALPAGAKYRYKAEALKTGSGADDWQSASFTVQSPIPQSDRREYRLFSFTPPATPRWAVRKIDPEHRNQLQAFMQSDEDVGLDEILLCFYSR
jgi:hypothetical protein